MEWNYRSEDNDTNNMEVDIGFIEMMQVTQMEPSSPVYLIDADGNRIDRR